MLLCGKKQMAIAQRGADIGLTLRSLAAFALEKNRRVQLDAG
jgi:hypothetical protein